MGMLSKKKQAQAIIELTVFGSVMFFLIGGTAMNYVNSSFQQNLQLQAMRQALLFSFHASQNAPTDPNDPDPETANRSSASYIVYEDRLTAEFGRYNVDRSPVVSSGNGMMTFQAMRSLDWPPADVKHSDGTWDHNESYARDEQRNIPVVDVVINGKHFEFRTAGFVRYYFRINTAFLSSSPAKVDDVDLGAANLRVARSNPNPNTGVYATGIYNPFNAICTSSSSVGGGVVGNSNNPQKNIRFFCGMEETAMKRLAFEWAKYPGYTQNNCSMGTIAIFPPFYRSIVGVDPDFSQGNNNSCAYDYNRNGVYIPDDMFPATDGTYSWYWRWAWDNFDTAKGKIDAEAGSYPSYDIDGDKTEETIYALENGTGAVWCPSSTTCYAASVLDPNAGDVDMAQDAANVPNLDMRQGIRPDMRIYSQTQCGAYSTTCTGSAEDDITYFDVKEGKQYSYGSNQPLSITKIKKNTLDIVERIYQMNPYMIDPEGFYCHNGAPGAALPPASAGMACACRADPVKTTVCDDATGSVDVMCTTTSTTSGVVGIGGGCCNTTPNVLKTCFDTAQKTLYIRSVINDKRARKWITATDQDWHESLGAP